MTPQTNVVLVYQDHKQRTQVLIHQLYMLMGRFSVLTMDAIGPVVHQGKPDIQDRDTKGYLAYLNMKQKAHDKPHYVMSWNNNMLICCWRSLHSRI